MLAVALGLAGLAWAGRLPVPPAAERAGQEKETLLSYLPDATGVSYARNVLYLYSRDMPLMMVWVEDDPAELYDAEGRFVAPLTFQDLSRVIRRATLLLRGDPRWPGGEPPSGAGASA